MNLYREIEKTFPAIEKAMLKEELLRFKDASLGDLPLYHFGLGTWVRNTYLRKESRLCSLFYQNNINHQDEMSNLIILLFHYHLSRKI